MNSPNESKIAVNIDDTIASRRAPPLAAWKRDFLGNHLNEVIGMMQEEIRVPKCFQQGEQNVKRGEREILFKVFGASDGLQRPNICACREA